MLVSEKPRGNKASASQPNVSASQPKVSANNPNVTPNASRWNIGSVGSPRVGARLGHVDFILFVSISFTLGSQCGRGWWNMGLSISRTS